MDKQTGVHVDVSKMDKDALLKLFETEWQDHFQARNQTWEALRVAAILTAAIVGIQWTTSSPLIGIASSLLLMGVSLFGMQITLRHRNSVERIKFTLIMAIEERLGLEAEGLRVPDHIGILDILRVRKSNTSLFLLRMQSTILVLGFILLLFAISRVGYGRGTP